MLCGLCPCGFRGCKVCELVCGGLLRKDVCGGLLDWRTDGWLGMGRPVGTRVVG